MYRKVAPMFIVEDVGLALAYYQDVFGAKLQYSHSKEPPYEWVSLRLDEVEVMFWQKHAAQRVYPTINLTSERGSDLIVYVSVDDADSLHGKIKTKVEVLMEPVDQFYGFREFTVRDRLNIIWTFAQDLEA